MLWNINKFRREQLALRQLKVANPELSPLLQAQIFQKIMLVVQAPVVEDGSAIPIRAGRLHVAKLATAFVLGLAALTGTAFAATSANPGDVLYPVKRAQENLRLNFALSEETKAQLKATFAHNRIREYKILSARPKKIVLTGQHAIKALSNQDIRLSAKKEIHQTLSELKFSESRMQKLGKIEAAAKVHLNFEQVKQEAKEQNLADEGDKD